MDPKIADFIRANRRTYTREAITEQLLDAGYDRAAIDATWAALHAPDPDETAGERFWGRFLLILVGINVAVLLLVGLGTGALFSPERIGLLGILAVVLAIFALIAWGIVALTGPAKMGRTTATVVGVVIPLVFALPVGAACYALVGAIGPPPRQGVMELRIGSPHDFDGSGAALCQVHGTFPGFSIYPQGDLGVIGGRPVFASVDSFPAEGGFEGEPRPAPQPGGAERPTVNINVSLQPRSETDPPQEWFVGPDTQIEIDAAPTGLSGTVTFEGLAPIEFEPPAPGVVDGGAISGSITWQCEEASP